MSNSHTELTESLTVLVRGAPATCKTTLARELTEYMRLLHIPHDEFFSGIIYTTNLPSVGRITSIPVCWNTYVYPAEHKVCLVIEGTFYKELFEAGIAQYLIPIACVVNVHCRATNEFDRFRTRKMERRERYGSLIGRLDKHQKQLQDIYRLTTYLLGPDCPKVEVDITATYNPAIRTIARQIGNRNNMLKGKE